jgi:hypothetical protein
LIHFVDTGDLIGEALAAIALFVAGIILIFDRQMIVESAVASGNAFWVRLGFPSAGKVQVWVGNLIVALMGTVFCGAGVGLFHRLITSFWS